MTAPIVPVSPASIDDAAAILDGGGLVAIPTETVYGLACDAANPAAVARLFAAKGRPSFNPLIAHVASQEMAERQAVFSETAARLAKHFWPGALTLVLPVLGKGNVCDLARAGLENIAIRYPQHEAAQSLIGALGRPIVAPSANRSGYISPTHAAHVAADLGDKIDMILDAGPCARGVESTILDISTDTPTLLRPGAIATKDVAAVLKTPLAARRGGTDISAPGQLKSHYAPTASLRLNAAEALPGEIHLGFGPGYGAPNLSASGDLQEAAANLFTLLRALDSSQVKIAVAPIPNHGLGEAINDRLERAAYREA